MPWHGSKEIARWRLIKDYLGRFGPGMVLSVVGRAGAGKTTFVRQLVERTGFPFGWIPLRQISSNAITFLQILEQKCEAIWPGIKVEEDVSAPDLETLVRSRVDQLLDLLHLGAGNPGILIFDNWEVVKERDLRRELLGVWLQRMPEFAMTVIISRKDPEGVGLPRIQASGRLIRLKEEDILFDMEETSTFLRLRFSLPEAEIRRIFALTKGWPAVLSLLARQEGPKLQKGWGTKEVGQFLQEEIWNDLFPSQRRALVYLALLEPFREKDLAQALTDELREEAEALREEYPFFFEKTGEQVGLQPLFGEFIRERGERTLSSKERESFHRKAARFFLSRGEVRALEHIFAIGDEGWAGKVLMENYPRWKEEKLLDEVVDAAEGFSAEYLSSHPKVATIVGEAHLLLGNWREAVNVLSSAYSSSLLKRRADIGRLLAEAYLLVGENERAAILCEDLLRELSRVSPQRLEVQVFLAIAYNQMNQDDRGLWRKVGAVARSRFLPLKAYMRCYLLLPKAVFFHLERGEFREAEEIVDYAIEALKREDPQHRRGWALLFKGVLKREQHQYEDAALWLREAVAASAKENRSVYALSLSMLALTMAEIDAEEAPFWLQKARDNLIFDRSLWAHCLVELAEAHMEPSSAARRIATIHGLSSEKGLTYLQALSAFTAFRLHEAIPRDQALYYLEQVIEVARRLKIKHREARALLYLWALSPESTGSHRWAQRALGLLREHKFDFLLTDDPYFDGLSLARWALQRGVEAEYLLHIWPRLGERGMEALMELFPSLQLEIKGKVVKLWEGMGYGPARPLLLQEGERAADASLRRLCRGAIRALDRLPPEPLHVKLLGGFSLLRGTRPVSQWRRQRSKDLFKYLVLHRGKPIPSDVLLEVFWPDLDLEKARANLWSTVSALRAALEPGLTPKAKSKYLLIEKEAYQLRLPEGSTVDVDIFERAAAKGLDALERGDEALALRRLEEAVRGYTGDLLPEDVYKDWTEEPRDHLQRLFNEVLKGLGRVYLRRQEFSPAIKILNRLLARDALDEEAYYLLMKAHLLRGEEVQAIKVYRRCEEFLEREMGISPSSELRLLYERIMERRSRKKGFSGAGGQGLPLRFP